MKGHYLMLVLPDGKHAIRREYLQLLREDETAEEAVERWIVQHPDMANRRRNRDRTASRLRAEIIETRICRPTSWHQEQCAKDGVNFPRPVQRRGRRRAA